MALRGYLTTYVNFCWGLGQVIGIGVIKSMLPRTDEWAYRVRLLLSIYFAPILTSLDSIRAPMDVARPSPNRRRSRSRIPLVACPQRAHRRRKEIASPAYIIKQGNRFRRRRDHFHDGAHHGTRREDHPRRNLLGLLQGH